MQELYPNGKNVVVDELQPRQLAAIDLLTDGTLEYQLFPIFGKPLCK